MVPIRVSPAVVIPIPMIVTWAYSSRDRAEALHHYARFVALYEDAEPGFQPRVDEARRALARLETPRR